MKPAGKLIMLQMAVNDMDKIKDFYTSKLGFTVTKDSKDYMPGADRWVTLELPEGGASITLTTVHENMKPGTMKLYLSASDIEATYEDLKLKGVQLSGEIKYEQWGTAFEFMDPEGNHWVVMKV